MNYNRNLKINIECTSQTREDINMEGIIYWKSHMKTSLAVTTVTVNKSVEQGYYLLFRIKESTSMVWTEKAVLSNYDQICCDSMCTIKKVNDNVS